MRKERADLLLSRTFVRVNINDLSRPILGRHFPPLIGRDMDDGDGQPPPWHPHLYESLALAPPTWAVRIAQDLGPVGQGDVQSFHGDLQVLFSSEGSAPIKELAKTWPVCCC